MQRELKIKVCGMRDRENILAVSALQPDYLGFIFYPGSKRFISPEQLPEIASIKTSCEKVGVFVNEKDKKIEDIAARMDISILQLHGDESPEKCSRLQRKGFTIIKAFPVAGADEGTPEEKNSDLARMDPARMDLIKPGAYTGSCDYFLFDTGGSAYGGSGKKFDWDILREYTLPLPFFLSGGIGPDELEAIRALDHPQLYAVDLNSRFERAPGLKNVELLRSFTESIRT